MPFRVGPTELIILLVILMLVFGVGRLPQVGNALSKSIKAIRKEREDEEDLVHASADTGPNESEAGKS